MKVIFNLYLIYGLPKRKKEERKKRRKTKKMKLYKDIYFLGLLRESEI